MAAREASAGPSRGCLSSLLERSMSWKLPRASSRVGDAVLLGGLVLVEVAWIAVLGYLMLEGFGFL
jgi:hypothetical protein